MAIKPLTIPQKIYVSCRETFRERSSALTAISILAATALSSSFRLGLLTSPLSFISSLGIQLVGEKILPKKLPELPVRIQKFFDATLNASAKILPNSGSVTGVLLGPAIEETVFRGALQPLLVSQVGAAAGIALSSAAFAAVHYCETFPSHLLSSFVGGIVLGSLSEKVSILASLGHHIAHNAFWFLGVDALRYYHQADYIENLRKNKL